MKKGKTEIINCERCMYWDRLGDSVEGICKASPYRAYRKRNQFCERAIKKYENR